jgi:hypothetical protein
MIDYDKLKTAHELAELYGKQIDEWMDVAVTLNAPSKNHPFPFAFGPTGKDFDNRFSSLDELIAKLEELTKPAPKFKVGDNVWVNCWSVNDANQLGYNFIKGVVIPNTDRDKDLSEPYVRIEPCSPSEGGKYSAPERFVYASRKELIDAQIGYWQSLKQQEEKTPIHDMKSFVSSYNQACDTFVNDILKGTGCQVVNKESDCQESIRKHLELDDGYDKDDAALQKFVNGFAYKRPKENCVHLASPFSPVDFLDPCKQKCIKCGEFY